jgi:hypothetical protein
LTDVHLLPNFIFEVLNQHMERKSEIFNRYDIEIHDVVKNTFKSYTGNDLMENNHVYIKLADEGCENLYNYIEWLGLAKSPNLIVLSSAHHYYYDAEDLKDAKTVVNLKLLNHIKALKDFLHCIYHNLPSKSFFIGSFFDNKTQNGFFSGSYKSQRQVAGQVDLVEKGIESRIPFLNMMYEIMDSRTNRFMTKRTVKLLLEGRGLKVLDMVEMDGLTYFCSQKSQSAAD